MKSSFVTFENLNSKFLQSSRDIIIYLPPSYESSLNKQYPVLYVHDGQHAFQGDLQGGSWDLHIAADHLISEGMMQEIIIVAISSVSHLRVTEYFHYNQDVEERYHYECAGELYERFIVEELKPLIDIRFRTLSDQQNTAMLGSSAGGLVSYHIGFRRPDVFGKIGILSPFFVQTELVSLESGDQDMIETKNYTEFVKKPTPPIKVWMDMGGAEGTLMVKHVRSVADQFIDIGFTPGSDFVFLLDPEASHTQEEWAKRIYSVFLYFFGDIGTPQCIDIVGRTTIGLNERHLRLYPTVTYDSGFKMSLLHADYSIDQPDIVSILSDGTLTPNREGLTNLSVSFENLKASTNIEIVQHISEAVELVITVEVPDSTPTDTDVHAGIKLQKVRDGLYEGRFILPRDLTFDIKVSKKFGSHEKRKESRRFSTTNNQHLKFIVKEWEE